MSNTIIIYCLNSLNFILLISIPFITTKYRVLVLTITVSIINAQNIKIQKNGIQISFTNVISCSVLVNYHKHYISLDVLLE